MYVLVGMAGNALHGDNFLCQNVERFVMQVTVAQSMKSVDICQRLSNLYRDIYLFRFDPLTGEIYILAGETLSVSIDQNGNVEVYA
jgi:hypothetical protein